MVFDGPAIITNPSYRQAQNKLTREELEAKHQAKFEQQKIEAESSDDDRQTSIMNSNRRGGYWLTRTEHNRRVATGMCLRCGGPHRATSCQDEFLPGPEGRQTRRIRYLYEWVRVPDPHFDIRSLAVLQQSNVKAPDAKDAISGFGEWKPLRTIVAEEPSKLTKCHSIPGSAITRPAHTTTDASKAL